MYKNSIYSKIEQHATNSVKAIVVKGTAMPNVPGKTQY